MIQTTEVSITYKGDGVQTSFPYPYPYRNSDDIVGYIINDLGYEKRITNNFKYDKVSNIYQYPLAGDPLAAPYSIKLIRETPQQQNADLPGKLPFSLIEKSLDWIIMILQEIGSCCNSLWHIRNDCKLSETNARNSASAAAESEENAANSEDMAKKWAMSPVSPDGVADTNSPTGYTQSAKIWAALSKEYAGLSKFKLPIGYYKSVAEMKASETAIVGRPCVTLGYYEPNDGGGGVYIIRQKKESDTDNGGSILVLDNGNVSELIIDGAINVKQFGAKGNGSTDDTIAIQNAITYSVSSYKSLYVPKGTYLITSSLRINGSIFINGEKPSNSPWTIDRGQACFLYDGTDNTAALLIMEDDKDVTTDDGIVGGPRDIYITNISLNAKSNKTIGLCTQAYNIRFTGIAIHGFGIGALLKRSFLVTFKDCNMCNGIDLYWYKCTTLCTVSGGWYYSLGLDKASIDDALWNIIPGNTLMTNEYTAFILINTSISGGWYAIENSNVAVQMTYNSRLIAQYPNIEGCGVMGIDVKEPYETPSQLTYAVIKLYDVHFGAPSTSSTFYWINPNTFGVFLDVHCTSYVSHMIPNVFGFYSSSHVFGTLLGGSYDYSCQDNPTLKTLTKGDVINNSRITKYGNQIDLVFSGFPVFSDATSTDKVFLNLFRKWEYSSNKWTLRTSDNVYAHGFAYTTTKVYLVGITSAGNLWYQNISDSTDSGIVTYDLLSTFVYCRIYGMYPYGG